MSLPIAPTLFEEAITTASLRAKFNASGSSIRIAARESGAGKPTKIGGTIRLESWSTEQARLIGSYITRSRPIPGDAFIAGYARRYEAARLSGDRVEIAEGEFDLVVALMEVVDPHWPVEVEGIEYWYGVGDEPDLYRRPLARYPRLAEVEP